MAVRSNNGTTLEGYGRGSLSTVIPSWHTSGFTYCWWNRVHATAPPQPEILWISLASGLADGLTLYYENTAGAMMFESAAGGAAHDTAVFGSRPAVGTDAAFFITCTGMSGTAVAGWRAAGSNTWNTVTIDTPGGAPSALEFFDFSGIGGIPGFNLDQSIENLKIWTRVLTLDEIDAETRYRAVKFRTSLNSHYWLRNINDAADRGPNAYALGVNGTPENSDVAAELWLPSALRKFKTPAAPAPSFLKAYVSGAFATKPVKWWSGSAWLTKPLKRWAGVDSNIALLLNGEGANGSTSIVDSSGNAFALSADGTSPVIDTSSAAQGGASIKFGGAGSVFTPTNAALYLSAAIDWTVDFWYYATTNPNATDCLAAFGNGNSWGSGLNLMFYTNTSRQFAFEYSNGTTSPPFSGWSATAYATGAWVHVELTFTAATKVLRIRVGGVLLGAHTISTWAPPQTVPRITVGSCDPAVRIGGGSAFYAKADSRIDKFRVTRNLVRHTADFTPDPNDGGGWTAAV